MRKEKIIGEAEAKLCSIVWYNRCHLAMRQEIKDGTLRIVKETREKWSGNLIS